MIRRWAALAAAAVLAACAPQAPQLPRYAVHAGPDVAVAAQPVALNPKDPAQIALGNFAYAGGIALTSQQTSRLHGLSDIEVGHSGRLIAISDEGDLFTARLVLDPAGRLTGLAEARLTQLAGLDGKPLPGKAEADAEGLAILGDGDMLVSFERDHRIWRYPANGGPPKPAPAPDATFPENGGMEALAADPMLGAGAYIAGGEESGQTWSCSLTSACVVGPRVPLSDGFNLVAARRLSGGRTAWLLRAFDPLRGARAELRVVNSAGQVLDSFRLANPLTVDNFEGLAAVERADGRVRFYLVSDDNFAAIQRTLLLAFDWNPRA